MNKDNIRFTTKVLSLALAAGITLLSPCNCFAEKSPKQGSFIEYTMENGETKYNRYVVKEGDNLSHISEKICRFFGEEITAKYWPVVAFLNEFPRTLRPGDIIIFPETYEELVLMYNNLKEIGWISRYSNKNDVYGKNKQRKFRKTIDDLLHEIYGNSVCVDVDFIRSYLKTVGLEDKYDSYSGDFGNDELFELTDWIPTLKEIENSKSYKKSK